MTDNKPIKPLVIIPARKGSKRVPKKNIKQFVNKPLIAWTIEAIKGVQFDADIVVSTDCELIAQIAIEYGADVPFMRPAEMASDTSGSLEMIEYTLRELEKLGRMYETLIYLQPTSPLRTSTVIESALETFERDENTLSLISVSETTHPTLWTMSLPDNLSMSTFVHKQLVNVKKRSQDLSQEYSLNGSIYIIDIKTLLKEKTFYVNEGCFAFITPKWQSIDIDDKEDFMIAEAICSMNLSKSKDKKLSCKGD
ncbi:MAG TPA: acylneuraminate cytidylyltransferase family protein [Saprospiraceae bacterium]|nr:acylneuraminate cytidylyltransferase family protein [Saprospiraceae bacterium]